MSQSSTASDRHVDVALSTIDKMSEYIRTGHQEIMEVGCDLLENKVENPNMDTLQECIVELVKAEQRVKAFTRSVKDIKTRWQNGELDESEDVVEILEKDLQKEEEKSLDERNVWDHEFMVAFVDNMKRTDPGSFKCGVDGGRWAPYDRYFSYPAKILEKGCPTWPDNRGCTVPPYFRLYCVSLKVGIGASQSNENDDDDMQMTQAHVSIKCPFTQCDMTNPVMDKQCGHSFEKEAVAAHIKQTLKRKKSPKCPYPGCSNVLELKNLEPNIRLKHVIQRKKREAPTEPST